MKEARSKAWEGRGEAKEGSRPGRWNNRREGSGQHRRAADIKCIAYMFVISSATPSSPPRLTCYEFSERNELAMEWGRKV